MMFSISRRQSLTGGELQHEKAKDYRNVVVLQLVIVVTGLTLSEPLVSDPGSEISKFIITLFSGFGTLYAFLLWDLLRNFTVNRILISVILVTLIIIVVVGTLAEFPYYHFIEVPDRRLYLFLLHSFLFPIELTVIGYAIRDIFSGGYLTSDKLWGAACVFLMIGISFGSLYDLISIARPGALGVEVALGLPNYSECVTYSFSVLGGVDTGLEPTRLVRNISTLEAVWGNLYGMLIIGKLLGLPRQEEPGKPA